MIEVDNVREALAFVDTLGLPDTASGDARAHAIIQSLVVAAAITKVAEQLAKAANTDVPVQAVDGDNSIVIGDVTLTAGGRQGSGKTRLLGLIESLGIRKVHLADGSWVYEHKIQAATEDFA